jgi:hypothetical protein
LRLEERKAREGVEIMVASPVRVNSKCDLIEEELTNVLELYSDELHKKISAIPEFRQKVIADVLDRIETANTDIQNRQHLLSKAKFPSRSLEFRLQIERYVHEGIARMLGVNLATLNRYIPRNYCVSSSPSQWFN